MVTAADQIISSGSNFVIGVLVGSIAGARAFGAYMIAFTVWLVVVGAHRALLTEPLVITMGDPTGSRELGYGVHSEMVLGVVLGGASASIGAVLYAVGSRPIATALLMLAPLLPALLLQDYWRAMAFACHRPDRALLNDSVFVAFQIIAIGGVVAAGRRTAPWFILAWGIGALAGAVVGFRQFRVAPHLRGGLGLLRSLWPVSRWQLADFATNFSADQLYLVVVVVTLGELQYGGLKAALSLMGPATVILLSGGNIGLPGAARALRQGGIDELVRFARRLTIGVASCIIAVGLVVFFFGNWALGHVYRKADFRQFGYLSRYVAVQYSVSVFAFGAGIALRVARQTRRLWFARLAVTVLSLTTVLVLSRRYGLRGAGWAGVLTGVFNAVAVVMVFRQYRMDVELGRVPDPAATLSGSTTATIETA